MRESRWQQFDVVIVLCAAVLVVFGVAMIHSATCASLHGRVPAQRLRGPPGRLRWHRLRGCWSLVSLIDYRFYKVYAYQILALALLLLAVVLIIGRGGADNDYGARRWIYLGVVRPPALGGRQAGRADRAGAHPERQARRPAQLPSPDRVAGRGRRADRCSSSSSPTWAPRSPFVDDLDRARARGRHPLAPRAAAAGTAAIASLPLVWLAMRDYMRDRLATFIGTLFDLEHAAFDEGYNVLQARISIGSGGLFGRGYLEGTQTPARLSAHHAVRLHLLGAGRGARLHRRDGAVLPVHHAAVPHHPRRRPVARRLRPAADLRRRGA